MTYEVPHSRQRRQIYIDHITTFSRKIEGEEKGKGGGEKSALTSHTLPMQPLLLYESHRDVRCVHLSL
jgi:hypothetical protein